MTGNGREIGLVSCVKTKRAHPAKPADLYTSPYFEKMRTYAEREHDEWWILSAKHGLLNPDGEPIEPYEETLTNAGVKERRAWADSVVSEMELEGLFGGSVTFVVHAGKAYYEDLAPRLERHESVDVEIPTKGLAFGETQAWYKERY